MVIVRAATYAPPLSPKNPRPQSYLFPLPSFIFQKLIGNPAGVAAERIPALKNAEFSYAGLKPAAT